jgi:hypothetical protein
LHGRRRDEVPPGLTAGAAFLHPDRVDRQLVAVGHFQLEALFLRQRVEQAHADAGGGNIADDAQELARRAGDLGGANERRVAPGDTLLGVGGRNRRRTRRSRVVMRRKRHSQALPMFRRPVAG